MTSDDIQTAIKAAIRELFDMQTRPDLEVLLEQPDFAFDRVTDSSIMIVDICFRVEEKLGVEIEVGDVFDHPTLSGFTARLLERVAAL